MWHNKQCPTPPTVFSLFNSSAISKASQLLILQCSGEESSVGFWLRAQSLTQDDVGESSSTFETKSETMTAADIWQHSGRKFRQNMTIVDQPASIAMHWPDNALAENWNVDPVLFQLFYFQQSRSKAAMASTHLKYSATMRPSALCDSNLCKGRSKCRWGASLSFVGLKG